MNIIKFRIARRQIEVVQLRVTRQLRCHRMQTAVQVHLDEAAQLIGRTERFRLIGDTLLRCSIIARRTPNGVGYAVPAGNRPHIVALAGIPAGNPINIVAVKSQKPFPVTWRRHGTGRQMVRMMPYAMLLQQCRREIRYARHIVTPRCSGNRLSQLIFAVIGYAPEAAAVTVVIRKSIHRRRIHMARRAKRRRGNWLGPFFNFMTELLGFLGDLIKK
jgi:hypothetical protein